MVRFPAVSYRLMVVYFGVQALLALAHYIQRYRLFANNLIKPLPKVFI